MINPDYKRREKEKDLDYAMRLVGIKKELKPGDLDWCDIVDLLGLEYNPDSLRKSQDSPYGGLAVYREMQKRISEQGKDNLTKGLKSELQELQKLKCNIADERAGLNKLLREQSRVEHIQELATKCVEKMEPLDMQYTPLERFYGNNTLVIALSDFHYGLEINEFNNKYDREVFEMRLEYLLSRAIDIIIENENIRDIIVLGLGDFIAGLIHNVIRVQSRENVIEQVVGVSDALIQFIYKLSTYLPVKYYDCVGNHSRLYADKDNCLSKESFDILIHELLVKRFMSDKDVSIMNYTINEKIGEFEAFGKEYAFCHGDGFNVATIAKDLSAMTKNFYEAIFIGHIHHVFIEEQNGTMVIANGSFAGNDEYSNKIRKTSVPSQNIFIISENGIEAVKTIKLDVFH
jgi:hypothetical protein